MYVLLTKKRISVILCCLVLGFILAAQFLSVTANGATLSTNDQRVRYIRTLGITLRDDNFIQKQITIPQEFSNVYNNYNALQREAGFDLKNYRGKSAFVYTYNIDDETVVNLIIYKDKLIGGDVSSLKFDGKMTALKGK